MNESFRLLCEEKQNRIRNAAMMVFSQNSYRKASTDDIAAQAGISKGLLFYHFKTKKELYCDMYEYCCERIYHAVEAIGAMNETDFFERNRLIVQARLNAAARNPYLLDFGLRAYYETDPLICESITAINSRILSDGLAQLSDHLDTSKFRSQADIPRAIKMIVWIGDGLIKERLQQGALDTDLLRDEVAAYFDLMKIGFYCERTTREEDFD